MTSDATLVAKTEACDPQYTAGIDPALLRLLGSGSLARKDEKHWP